MREGYKKKVIDNCIFFGSPLDQNAGGKIKDLDLVWDPYTKNL